MNLRDVHPCFLENAGAGLVMASGLDGGGAAGPACPEQGSAARSPNSVKGLPPQVYLALDQSMTNVGLACATPNMEHPVCKTYKPRPIKAPSGEDLIEVVLLGLESFLLDQFNRSGVTHVFIETVYFDRELDNPAMFAKLTTIRDFIRYLCARQSTPIRLEEISPRVWRKHFLGFSDSSGLPEGMSLKDAAMMICGRVGWSVVDEHQAEACGILVYALSRDFPRFAPNWDPRLLGLTP